MKSKIFPTRPLKPKEFPTQIHKIMYYFGMTKYREIAPYNPDVIVYEGKYRLWNPLLWIFFFLVLILILSEAIITAFRREVLQDISRINKWQLAFRIIKEKEES